MSRALHRCVCTCSTHDCWESLVTFKGIRRWQVSFLHTAPPRALPAAADAAMDADGRALTVPSCGRWWVGGWPGGRGGTCRYRCHLSSSTDQPGSKSGAAKLTLTPQAGLGDVFPSPSTQEVGRFWWLLATELLPSRFLFYPLAALKRPQSVCVASQTSLLPTLFIRLYLASLPRFLFRSLLPHEGREVWWHSYSGTTAEAENRGKENN